MRMTANTWRPPALTGPPAMGWIAGSGNISYLNTNDPTAARAFFDTPNSFCTGASLVASPVPGTYHTTPVLSVDSYTNSASNASPGLWGDGTNGPNGGLLPKGSITYGYKWIMYDNEVWANTPTAEQNDPVTYMQDFISACHNNTPRYKAIMAPGYGLFSTAQGAWPRIPSTETQTDWFVRVIVGMGAVGCDLFLLQNESQQGTGNYATLWNKTAAKMAAVNPGVPVFAEVASDFAQTGSLTGPQLGTSMAANAQTLTSPYPDGFYVAMPSSVTNGQAGGRYFLDDMKAAGYTA